MRLLAPVCAAVLAGCAALEVQVDVYKGPLVNHQTIQLQQLTSIAMSARVLVVSMRDKLVGSKRARGCASLPRGQYVAHAVVQACLDSLGTNDPDAMRIRQLNGVLSFFESLKDDGHIDPLFAQGRSGLGIDALAKDLQVLLQTPTTAEGDPRIHETRRNLERALIDLAARLNFIATNMYLLDTESGAENAAVEPGLSRDEQRRFKSLLEAVANTILVHADDLHHRNEHDARQDKSGNVDAERRAANEAFRPAGSAFDLLLAALRDKRDEALAREAAAGGRSQAVSAELTRARAAATRAGEAWQQAVDQAGSAQQRLNEARMLLAMLGDPADACRRAPVGGGVLTVSCQEQLRAAAKAMAPAQGPATLSQAALRAELRAGLQTLATGFTGELQDHPSARRVSDALAALAALDALPSTQDSSAPRATAVGQLRGSARLLLQTRQAAHFAAVERELQQAADQRRSQADLQRAQAAETALVASSGGTLSAARWAAALDKVAGQRPALAPVLAQAGKLGDLHATRQALEERLRNAAAATPVDVGAADALAALAGLQVKQQELVVGSSARRITEVLDAVITQLRYQHLAAIGRGDDTEARRLQSAIATAFEQRAGMAYLRPSSAYLRSVFAATEAQSEPGLGWRNLLNDTGSRALRNALQFGYKPENVRDTLDKAFWQNINTVRVNAGGASNFVIAKDDVGNWYVKAMGSDAGAMIRTAKQLALYNTGLRFDSNLLRVDDLRARLDRRDLSAEERSAAETEHRELSSGRAGGGARQTQSLSLFKEHFDSGGRQQQAELVRLLDSDAATGQLLVLWRDRYKAAGADMDAVFQSLLSTPKASGQLASSRSAALPAADKPVGTALVASLTALQAYRRALRDAVRQSDALIASEQAALAAAEPVAQTARQARAQVLADLDRARQALAQRRSELKAAQEAGDAGRADELHKQVELAAAEHESLSARLSSLLPSWAQAEKDLTTARQRLDGARQRREAAARDVDDVWGQEVERRVTERLRQITEYETALKVIGRSDP